MFRDPSIALHHVQRDGAEPATIARLTPQLRESANFSRLGIDPVDLFQSINLFVVVEGEHDKAVLETWLAADLDLLRAHVVCMRGTKHLTTIVDSDLIFDFTSAAILVVLDGTIGPDLHGIWTRVVELDGQARAHAARDALRGMDTYTGRGLPLYALARAALEKRRLQRLDFFGFSKKDIIEYLPVRTLVPGEDSWHDLRASLPTGEDFKEWLRAEHGAQISTARLRAILSDTSDVPEEFSVLRERCYRMVSAALGFAATNAPADREE